MESEFAYRSQVFDKNYKKICIYTNYRLTVFHLFLE